MKKMILKWSFLGLSLIATNVILSSCSDDPTVDPPPSVVVEPTTSAGLAGTTVSAEVTITAPGGLEELIILKNGANFDSEIYAGEKEATFPFEYIIEDLPNGTVTNFTFQALDGNDRFSNLATISVTVSSKEVVEVTGVINASANWTADKIYHLNGFVRVGDDAKRAGGTNITGVTLTIAAGTIIMGDRETKGTLVVQRGNKIVAVGTAADPIVFTSERAPGQRLPGDWGGLVIVGRATNNQGANVELEGGYGAFHGIGDTPLGAPDDDDSGELKYVRIEYAGIPINPNQEVNSLTMGSVGATTKLTYVQCSFGLDDQYEWFGGKVNAKYLVAYRGLDDDFDCDFGFTGNIQWAIGIRDNTLSDQSGSNGFEVDNDGAGSGAVPFTAPVFSNVSIIGAKKNAGLNVQDNFNNAMHLRRNNKIKIYNSLFTGYPNGLFIQDAGTITNAVNAELQLRNIVLAGVEGWGGNGYGSIATAAEIAGVTGLPFGTNTASAVNPRGFIFATTANIGADPAQTWFSTAAFGNVIEDKWTDIGINESYFDLGTPNFLPTGTVLLNKANLWTNTPAAGAFFDKTVTYIGAFGAENWTAQWTNFNPQATNYQ